VVLREHRRPGSGLKYKPPRCFYIANTIANNATNKAITVIGVRSQI
jgi:hypothetical protein